MKRFLFLFLFFYTLAYAEDISYKFGRGLNLGRYFWFGGYISLNYWKKNSKHSFKLDDLAFLTRISLNRFSIFSELEADDVYVSSSTEKNRYWHIEPEIERLYVNYYYNEFLNFKIGRFLTPLGIWNKIHIDALKWTASDPLVSTFFFPMFTTGLNLNGYLPFLESLRYDFFIQKGKGINASYNNIKTDDMVGFQLEKIFDINKKIGLNGGIFDADNVNEKYKFLGVYGKTKLKNYYLSSEVYYANERKKGNVRHKEHGKITYYVQVARRVFNKTYFIFRKDGLYDSSDKHRVDIWTFTLNFKPRFNISMKAEYQLYERKNDYIRLSFALLF